MKKCLSVLFLVSSLILSAQRMTVRPSIFPQEKGDVFRVEMTLGIHGEELHFKAPSSEGLTAGVVVNMHIDSLGTTILRDRYQVVQDFANEQTLISQWLYSQVAYQLYPGEYQVHFTIRDLFGDGNTYEKSCELQLKNTKAWISDLKLIGDTTDLHKQPDIGEYYTSRDRCKLFFEAGSWESNRFLLRYQLLKGVSKEVVKTSFLKGTKGVLPVFVEWNLEDYEVGEYVIVAELLGETGNRLAIKERKLVIESPINELVSIPKDSVDAWLSYLTPVLNPADAKIVDRLLAGDNPELRVNFWLNYWREESETPLKSWQDYLRKIYDVNRTFGTFQEPGFLTDRGRTFLKHGPPDSMNDFDNLYSHKGSYQVWHYYNLEGQNDIRLVFLQLSHASNVYRLVHSDLRDGIKNPNWENEAVLPELYEMDRNQNSDGNSINEHNIYKK